MRIGLAIPVYYNQPLHADFTRETIESIKSKHDIWLYLIVNHSTLALYPKKTDYKLSDCIKNFEIVDNPKGNQVSSSWNQGIKLGLQDACKYVVVANNDIVFHPECLDNLIGFAEEHQEFIIWTASEYTDLRSLTSVKLDNTFDDHPHFSCFMVNKRTIDEIGWFDESFKGAYFEDGDYHYRILISGNKGGKSHGSYFYHYGSRTIRCDEELNNLNLSNYEYNRNYLKVKLGVDLHGKVFEPPISILNEGYKYPFNNSNKSWKE